MNLALKLPPKENYFTEELVGILWTEFKFFYIKLKQIWSLFAPAKAKKNGFIFFFFFWMKAIPSPNLALKLAPNDNHFTEYLMNWIQVVYFKLKQIWLLFSIAKAKKPSSFLLNESKYQPKFDLEVRSQ